MTNKNSLDSYIIKELMTVIENGNVNIPRFQREFVWKEKKIIKLMDSIIKNYPIGLLLISNSSQSDLRSGRNEIIDAIVQSKYKNNASIVVDGQQRLTSLIIVYFASRFTDLISNKKIVGKNAKTIIKTIRGLTFYNGKFLSLEDLIEEIEEREKNNYSATTKAKTYLIDMPEINRQVQSTLNNKFINIQTLSNWSDEEIINIFTAMNSKTKPLTHIDLMNGAMFNASDDNFDLIGSIKSSNNLWANFGKINDPLFVILIKIYHDLKLNYPYQKTNYKTDKLVRWSQNSKWVNEFVKRYDDFENTIKQTLSILDIKLNIYTIKNIPKEVYLIAVFAIVVKKGSDYIEKNDMLNKTISDITLSLIYGDYASSPNAKIMDYLNNILLKRIDGLQLEDGDNFAKLRENRFLTLPSRLDFLLKESNYKRKNSAIFKLFISTVASEQPFKLFTKNEKIPVRPTEVTMTDTDIHHFIPAKSNSAKKYGLGRQLDLLPNLTLMTKEENRNKIRNSDLSDYLKKSLDILEEQFDNVMISHLMDPEQIRKIIKTDFIDGNPVVIHNLIDKLFLDRRIILRDKIISKFLYNYDELDMQKIPNN